MSDKRYRVRWYGVGCSGWFSRTFEDKEDAEMFAQRWLLDCILGIEGIHEDYFSSGDSFRYEVVAFFPMPIVDISLGSYDGLD